MGFEYKGLEHRVSFSIGGIENAAISKTSGILHKNASELLKDFVSQAISACKESRLCDRAGECALKVEIPFFDRNTDQLQPNHEGQLVCSADCQDPTVLTVVAEDVSKSISELSDAYSVLISRLPENLTN